MVESSHTLIEPNSSRMLNNLAEKSLSVSRLTCPLCKKCYKSIDTLRVHCKRDHKIRDNICVICETKCRKFPLLIKHINDHNVPLLIQQINGKDVQSETVHHYNH